MRVVFSLFLLLLTGCAQIQAGTDSLLMKGVSLYEKGRYTEALEIFENGAGLAINKKDTPLLVSAYRNIGNVYSQTGKQVDALKYYQQSVALSDASGSKGASANTIQNIGALHEEMGDYKRALESYSTAELIAKERKDSATIADCANNKGIIYEQYLGRYDDALAEYAKALGIYLQMNNYERAAICYNNLGVVYKQKGDYVQAIHNYELSLQLAENGGYQFLIAANLTNIGNVYSMKREYAKAIGYNKRAMQVAVGINAMSIMVETTKNIAEDYERVKDYRQAYEWRKKYSLYNDSLVNTERSRQVAELETKYQNERKEKEITQLKQQQEISELKLLEQQLVIQRNRYQLWAIFLLIVLAIIVTALIVHNQRQRQKQAYEKGILEAEEQERKRISREMHDDIGAGLTQITLISEAARHSGNVQSGLTDIAGTSRKLVGSLGEIIWSLDPESRSVGQLYAYMREQLDALLEHSGIAYELHLPQDTITVVLTSPQKRSLLLVTKEAVNNAIKYSGAERITVRSVFKDNMLSFVVQDNGKGFNTSAVSKGNGLRNMQVRIRELGGNWRINSSSEGTSVFYSIPV